MKTVKVAKKFCRLMRKEIGAKRLAKAIRLNRTEKDRNVCHTHDFCDANMVMDEAIKTLRLPGPAVVQGTTALTKHDAYPVAYPKIDDEEEENTKLWNEAWDLAKKAEFDPKRIK